MNRIALIISFVLFSCLNSHAQTELTMQTGTFDLCDAAFLDSGGNTGTYGPNENYILTICPDVAGDAIYVEFLTANLICPDPNNDCDFLEVHDGDNVGAPSMGYVNGAITFTASPLNNTGCLTFHFVSNGAAEGTGWAGTVTCETPCDRPFAQATTTPDEVFPIKVCLGEEIEFDGTSSYAAPGFTIDDWTWDFRDGTIDNSGPIVNHSYTEPGEYVVQLYLVDDNDCASSNRTDIQIWVATPPNIDIYNSANDFDICTGQEVCVSVNPEEIGIPWDAQPTVELGAGITVPDIVGECFESEAEFNSFEPGQTLNDIDDLLNIFINMEHSFIGDLLIQITCPDGTTVNLHEQGGGGINLGEANQADDEVPGVGWDYYWSQNATLGTWAEEANGNNMPSGTGTSLIPDTYSTVGNLSDLVGCPLNGIWSLSICDLWGADDGTVFEWTINFNPDIYPELTSFTPIYGADQDSTYWTGADIVYSDANADSACVQIFEPGTTELSFYTINDFGCEFDTTLTFTVLEPLPINAGSDAEISCETPYQLHAYLDAIPSPTCDYTINLLDNAGNGWNGGELEIIIDGVSNTYTSLAGPSNIFTLPVNHESEIEIIYTAGMDPQQNEYMLFDGNGVLVFQDGEFGAVPTEGSAYSATAFCFPPQIPLQYSWTPAFNLDNQYSQSPTLSGLTEATTFTVEVWDPLHPDCIFSDEVTLTVAGALDAGEDIAACAMSYTLNATNISNGEWTAPAGSGITFSNPTSSTSIVTGTTEGTYTISWTDLDGLSCPNTSTLDVTFFNQINIIPTITEPFCFGMCNGELLVSASGGNIEAGTDYIYNYSGGNIANSDNHLVDLCTGNYTITLQDNDLCESSLTIFVDQPPAPVIDSISVKRESCLGECDGEIVIYSSVAETYSFDGGLTNVMDSINSEMCGGFFNVKIADPNGCEASQEVLVPSPIAPQAMFAADPVRTGIFSPQIQFTNFSEGNVLNDWMFGMENMVGTSTELNPSFSFPAIPGIYTVQLTITDTIGCQDSSRVDIEIMDEFQVFVPTAFSPNDDGINDFFQIEIQDLDPTDYNFQVFDRWGTVVYETSDYPTQWNGQGVTDTNFYAGNGVYVWRIKARSASTTERIEKMGMVTLIR